MNVALFLEIKNEYTEHLVDTITPYIYEGLTSIYNEAVKFAKETNYEDKILQIFQRLLKTIDTWNQMKISEETNRIKQLSNTSEYLDDLVKAVIKSNIILLAYSNSISNIIGQTFYNSLTTSTFIHRCYTECGKDAHNNPYLFFHDVDPMDYKRNQIIVRQQIEAGIVKAIRKILPISMILKEYLLNSINIIQEPTKVELIGTPNIVENQIQQPNILPENKLDTKLEREVMKIIKSDNIKSDKQKIQAIMNIDKLLTVQEPNKPFDLSAKRDSVKKSTEFLIAPHLIEQEEEEDFMNSKMGESDKKILNINFDEEQTVEGSESKKSVSGTSLGSRAMPSKNGPKMNPETSERIDPTKVNLIEDYGQQGGNSRKNAGKRR